MRTVASLWSHRRGSKHRAPAKRASGPRRWLRLSLRGLLLLVSVCAFLSWYLRPQTLDPSYFPIGVGYRWVYQETAGSSLDDVVFEVIGTEKVGQAECFVVRRTIGDHQVKFYVEVADSGVLIHRVGDEFYRPAYRQFAFYSKLDDEWNWSGTIGGHPERYWCRNNGKQPISVPMGQWDAFWVNQESQTSDLGDTDFCLVKKVGVVRIKAKYPDRHDPPPRPNEKPHFDWQLKEFSRTPAESD